MKKLFTIFLPLVPVILITACSTIKLPVLAVRLSNDDGADKAPITRKEIEKWVDHANKTWEDAGYTIVFKGDDDIIEIKSTILNTQPPDNAYDQWELYRIAGNYITSLLPPDRIPVFFRQKGANGWSGGPGDTNFISMPSYSNACTGKPAKGEDCPNGCCPNNALLSHELGSYFGLNHAAADTPDARSEEIKPDQKEVIKNSLKHPWRNRLVNED